MEIVKTLLAFEDNDYARVFDKEHFYFNKQALMLTNVDSDGRSFAESLKPGKKSQALNQSKSPPVISSWIALRLLKLMPKKYQTLAEAYEVYYKPLIAGLDYKEQALSIETAEGVITTATGKP